MSSKYLENYSRPSSVSPSRQREPVETIPLKQIDPDLHLNVTGNNTIQRSPTKRPWELNEYGENLPNRSSALEVDAWDNGSLSSVLCHSVAGALQHVTSHIVQPPSVAVTPTARGRHRQLVPSQTYVLEVDDENENDVVVDDVVADVVDDDEDADDIYYEASPLPPQDSSKISYGYLETIDKVVEEIELIGESVIPQYDTVVACQMKYPLLLNSSPLDLSSLAPNPKSLPFFPFYDDVVDLDYLVDDEAILLSIWQYEFELLSETPLNNNRNWFSTIRNAIFGPSMDSYYKMYPWCQFIHLALFSFETTKEMSLGIEHDVYDFIDFINQ